MHWIVFIEHLLSAHLGMLLLYLGKFWTEIKGEYLLFLPKSMIFVHFARQWFRSQREKLKQYFSSFNVHSNHLGILLQWTFWCNRPRAGLRFCIHLCSFLLKIISNNPILYCLQWCLSPLLLKLLSCIKSNSSGHYPTSPCLVRAVRNQGFRNDLVTASKGQDELILSL